MQNIDELYKNKFKNVGKFVFDEKVANVFENMLNRSIPNYDFVLKIIGQISKDIVKNETNVYDLGCSLGASSFFVLKNNPDKNFTIFAVDNSQAMIEKAKENYRNLEFMPNQNIEFLTKDINDLSFENASFVILNFTLQFVDVNLRFELLQKIFKGLNKNGALILSEKLKFENEQEENLLTDLYHAFKKNNGYSDLEISQKKTALEDVLIRETEKEHFERLRKIGFTSVVTIQQAFNFVSFLAVKS